MTRTAAEPEVATSVHSAWQPRLPALSAFGLHSLWVLVLCLPMFAGKLLVNPAGDQMYTGLPFRWFGAEEWLRTGQVPLWNPYMFGGLPFVGAMHGDIFYPTAWLRLFLPIDVALNFGFAIHVVLAGFFAYLFFRALGLSWTASVAAGIAYQLSGIVASMVSPGHDGKLFVSALLPLVLTGVLLGARDRRLEGFGLLALAAGAGIISPHIQMMQYTLIFAGLFTLYLCFWAPDRPDRRWRWTSMAIALGAVALAFGIAWIQLWPFIQYMPYAARAAGAQGWEYATSWAMPIPNIVDWLVSDFTGVLDRYSGENFGKLHSEYIGATVLGLAAIGAARSDRRRLAWFMGGAGLLFVLVSLGGHTPFYRLWYAIVPGVKVTRAAGMAFFIPTFVFALFAGLGVERLERGERTKLLPALLVAAALLLLMGISGALGGLAQDLARPERASAAVENAGRVTLTAVKAALLLAAVAGLVYASRRGRLRGFALAGVLALLIGGDLFHNVRRFWMYSPPASEIFADDAVTRHLATAQPPYRVLDPTIYPGAYLMGKRVPQVLGHHGNELNEYDSLLGGKNVWQNLGAPQLWGTLAVRFIILDQSRPVPGFHQAVGPTRIPTGQTVVLLEADTAPPYARVVPGAAKLPNEQMVPTLMDPRMDVSRLVLLPPDAPVEVAPLTGGLPEPSPSRAVMTSWEPGKMAIRLEPAPAAPSYVVVSENWYPDWRATVDGQPGQVLRGDYTLLTVPVAAGAREVTLQFSRGVYNTGKLVTLVSLLGTVALLVVPVVRRRRRTRVG